MFTAIVICSAPAYRLANTSNLLIRLTSKGASAPFSRVDKVHFVYAGSGMRLLFDQRSAPAGIGRSDKRSASDNYVLAISLLVGIKLPDF